eukprot:3790806-Amphidinium_carterae.3
MPESEGIMHNGHRVSAGLFGVPKKQTPKARLIVDRRPQNCLEVSLRKVVMDRVLSCAIPIAEGLHFTELMTLPFFGQFARLMLSSSSRLHITMEDAENYYYHMLLPKTLQRTNAVGPLVDASALPPELPALLTAQAEFGVRSRWSLHMIAPPMGDIKSPDIAQAVHTHVALECGGMSRASWMRHGQAAPTDAIWSGTYVDDFGQAAVLDHRLPPPLDASSTLTRAQHEHSALLSGYSKVGIVRKPEKSVAEKDEGSMWGAVLSTTRKSVQCSPEKVLVQPRFRRALLPDARLSTSRFC